MWDINAAFRKFFRKPLILKIVAYSTLLTSLTLVFGAILFLYLGEDEFSKYKLIQSYVVYFIGSSFLTIITLGWVVFKPNFCTWSRTSWFIIVIYYLATFFQKIFGSSERIDIIVTSVLSTMTVLTLFYLIKENFQVIRPLKKQNAK